MIKAIIFDFGDIFINLNKSAMQNAFAKLGLKHWTEEFDILNMQFEIGAITENQFLTGFQKTLTEHSIDTIKKSWNTILEDFPCYRLDFLNTIKSKYRLFLLSNTDAIHIQHFKKTVGDDFYNSFFNAFEKVYFSFEAGIRKPEAEIYEMILKNHQLKAAETLFVDDRPDNIKTAEKLGVNTWHLQVGKEDVIELEEKIKHFGY